RAGSDEFTYRLRDSFGARATGTIRVGVVEPAERNSAPVGVDDVFTVAPGALVRVPVLSNDSDPDGDPLSLEELAPLNPELPAGVELDGDIVVLNAGDDGVRVSVQYGITDGRGQRATAT